MNLKKHSRFVTLFCGILVLVFFVSCSAKNETAKPQETTRISIATGNTGGLYYVLGGGLTHLINTKVPGVQATAEVTAASIENCNLMQAGDVEMAFINTDILMYSYAGTDPFTTANKDLRHIGKLYPSTMQAVALQSSGIKTISDIKGKKIAIGAPGAGQRLYIQYILDEYGMQYTDFSVYDLTFNEAVDAMKDDLIDGAFVHSGVPNATVMDLALVKNINLIPIDEDKADRICAKYPFLGKSIIPADMYKTESAITVGALNSLACSSKLSEEVIYQITKVLFENLDYMRQTHDIANLITAEASATSEIPLHPGAERYYKEKGILK